MKQFFYATAILFLVIAIVLLNEAKAQPKNNVFEYKHVQCGTYSRCDAELQSLSKEGWEIKGLHRDVAWINVMLQRKVQ